MKKKIALFLVMVLSCSFLAELQIGVVSAETKNNVISAGEEHEVTNSNHYCEFTPEESGWYKFYSLGKCDVEGRIYNSANERIAESDNYDFDFLGIYHISGNFKLFHYFEAGETYSLDGILHDGEDTYYLGVEKLPKATGVSILQQEEVNVGIGLKQELKLNYSPQDCIPEKETWTSDNTDIISIDEEGVCHFKKYGTATVTVTTESGLSDSIVVNVTDSSGIKLNEEKQGYAGHYQNAEYVFIPEVSGQYAISVKSVSGMIQQAPVMIYIYDKDYNLIASENEWTTDSTLYYDMKIGECYCIMWKSYGGDVLGKVTTTVKLAGLPDYSDGTDIDSTDELQQVGEEIALEDIKEIKLDEEKQIDITYFGANSIHKFIPTEDGEYKFTVSGNDFVLIDVSDDNFNTIYSEKKSPFTAKLEAGNTYIINSNISSSAYSGLGQYNVEINKLPKAETINITNGDKIVEHIGYKETLNVVGTPEECESEELEWISSDESVVEVINGTIYLKNVGGATITVKNERGLTDTIEVECVHHPEIKCDKNQSLTSLENSITFTFIPEVSGLYNFVAETNFEDLDLRGKVVKVPQETELSFLSKEFINLEYQFIAGEIYYITVETTSENALGIVDYSLELKSKPTDAPTPESTKTPEPVSGDVDYDGVICASDALLVLKHAARLETLSDDAIILADVTQDETVNADDALEILRYAAILSRDFN